MCDTLHLGKMAQEKRSLRVSLAHGRLMDLRCSNLRRREKSRYQENK